MARFSLPLLALFFVSSKSILKLASMKALELALNAGFILNLCTGFVKWRYCRLNTTDKLAKTTAGVDR
jgi:hypothetical protein